MCSTRMLPHEIALHMLGISSALSLLDKMPALTKASKQHKEYEENLLKDRVRGQRAAAIMDAFQGFAAQV